MRRKNAVNSFMSAAIQLIKYIADESLREDPHTFGEKAIKPPIRSIMEFGGSRVGELNLITSKKEGPVPIGVYDRDGQYLHTQTRLFNAPGRADDFRKSLELLYDLNEVDPLNPKRIDLQSDEVDPTVAYSLRTGNTFFAYANQQLIESLVDEEGTLFYPRDALLTDFIAIQDALKENPFLSALYPDSRIYSIALYVPLLDETTGNAIGGYGFDSFDVPLKTIPETLQRDFEAVVEKYAPYYTEKRKVIREAVDGKMTTDLAPEVEARILQGKGLVDPMTSEDWNVVSAYFNEDAPLTPSDISEIETFTKLGNLAFITTDAFYRLKEQTKLAQERGDALAASLNRERELRAQKVALESMRSLQTVAADTTHHLGNASNALGTNLDLIGLHISKGNFEKANSALDRAKSDYVSLKSPMERLKNLTHSVDKFAYQDIQETLETAVASFEGKSGLVIERNYGELPELLYVENVIQQVIYELLFNADRVFDEREIPEKERKIAIETFIEDAYGVVSIRDTAGGFAQEDVSRVFDNAYTTKKKGEGVGGHGLGYCQTCMTMHNGKLDLESTIGEGTTFKLYFPLNGKNENIRSD